MGKKSNTARFPVVRLHALTSTHPGLPTNHPHRHNKARLKKLIQADEDVGKVAQATPIVLCLLPLSVFIALKVR
jgi:hypothetical protein